MTRNLAASLSLLVVVSMQFACGGGKPEPASPADAGAAASFPSLSDLMAIAEGGSYDDELAKVMADPKTADYLALRMTFTKTASYDPYDKSGEGLKKREAMFAALEAGDDQTALDIATSILDTSYVDMDAQMVAMVSCHALGLEDQKVHHDDVLYGLVTSILDSGDGTSPQTAMVVIDIREEYVLLSMMGLDPGNQALVEADGMTFDRMQVTDPKTGDVMDIYFNVTIPFSWLSASMAAAL